jgi:hypothetical protein
MANVDPFGVDLSTGKNRTLKAGDVLTDDQGNPLVTSGNTGIQGITGIALGQTGIQSSISSSKTFSKPVCGRKPLFSRK